MFRGQPKNQGIFLVRPYGLVPNSFTNDFWAKHKVFQLPAM